MAERTPTIEQKSTFNSKTKEGSDVEFVATIKFYVNTTGDVKITGPVASGEGHHGHKGRHGPGNDDETLIGAGPPPEDLPLPEPQKEPEVKRGGHHPGRTMSKPKRPDPPMQGECPIAQFIPDPCKAIEDLSSAFKSFFSRGSSGCPPCPPREQSNSTEPLKLQQLITEEVPADQANMHGASDIIDQRRKYNMYGNWQ